MFKRDRWWANELARREREWATERKELLDRIMYMAGRTWEIPPVEPAYEPEIEEEPYEIPELQVIDEAP